MHIVFDIPLGFRLGGVVAGTAAIPPPAWTPVVLRHTLVYGQQILLQLESVWSSNVPQRTRLVAAYGDTAVLRQSFRSDWGVRPEIRIRHVICHEAAQLISQSLRLRWATCTIIVGRHVSCYGQTDAIIARWQSPYWLTTSIAKRQVAGYHLLEHNPVQRNGHLPWALLENLSVQSVMNSPELVWSDRTIRIVKATLSCDEDSPVWIARIEIATINDFALMQIGDPVTLTLGLESFAFIIDGKTFSRTSAVDQQCEITAVSPVALRDAPLTGAIQLHQTAAIPARAAVESLIGAVDWLLPEWTIPTDRLRVDGATPLVAARHIVAAIGGIVESHADGAVLCRRRHPVSLPQYGVADVAHRFGDSDVIASGSQVAKQRGYKRVTLANEEAAGSAADDRIESIADPDNPWRRTVRAYLAANRPAALTHTGNPHTIIGALGKVTRRETETVEFVAGQASVRYPVTRIVSALWRHADLGAISIDGANLTSSIPGYSLLVITYTTTSLDWRVRLDADEDVQFVLVDI